MFMEVNIMTKKTALNNFEDTTAISAAEGYTTDDLSPIKEDSKKPSTKIGKATNSKFVRVRKVPSSSSTVVTLLADGDRVKILETLPKEGWYKIQVERTNEIGYVAKEFIKEE